jgi:signal transduction histidine kinase/ligand-binding sensor domain-containing protein
MAQTQDGFIWLGTPVGLARFDGLSFDEFSSTNFVALPNRGIVALSPGRDGGLHLGMDRGAVVSLHVSHTEVFVPDNQLSLITINSLTEDDQGALWVGYRDGSLGRIYKGQMTRFAGDHGFPRGPMMCSLACDPKGRLWFVKNGQLGRWRGGAFETLKTLPEPVQARLAVARGGGLWVCAGSHLYRANEACDLEDHGTFTPRQAGTEPSALLEGRDGAVWIGTTFSGLVRYQAGAFESVPTTHQEILSLMEDAEGNIWAGTGGGGLNQVRPRAMTLENSDGGLSFEGVQSLCEDRHGVVWAALQNGALARWRDGRWQSIPTGDSWAGDAVCVCADPAGAVWVGTRYHRLLCWREDGFVPWGDPSQIKGQTIHTLLMDTNGDLWLGEDTPVAVQRLHEGKARTYDMPSDQRVIRASAVDASGTVWFGTSRGVLLHVVGNHIVDETTRTTGEPQSIRSLCGTPDGTLWIAYAGWGLGLLKDGKFAVINTHLGMYDDFISQIVADERGWLWFGGNRGLFKVRQKELDAVAEGRMGRVRAVHFGPGEYSLGEGRPSLQANFGSAPLALRSHDGRLWLPMRTGLLVVDPARLHENRRPPNVLVNRVKVSDAVVAAYGGFFPVTSAPGAPTLDLATPIETLRIPPDHRKLEFEFTGLNFAGAENNTYRYRLEGLDEDWTETSQRNAVYSRLAAGSYQFHVLACNSEGVWNEPGANLRFVVTPFFWNQWWFRTVVLATFTGIIIATVRYVSFRRLRLQLQHLEQQAALHRERARIAKDIHDDLGASLTQISLIGELARQDRSAPEKVAERIEGISNTARRAVRSLDEIVWAVNPRNDTLTSFIDYTGQYALDYLRIAGLRCRLDLPDHVADRELSTDVRHNLFLAVKEAITNTVKHSQATELRLQIKVLDEKLKITIEDNGQGFETRPEDSMADGLRNMQQRLEDIGGKCAIEGQRGSGTKVTIELSLGSEARNSGKP